MVKFQLKTKLKVCNIHYGTYFGVTPSPTVCYNFLATRAPNDLQINRIDFSKLNGINNDIIENPSSMKILN